MMTAEQLKASILQLAMKGKLVEQRPEEGTGEELYKEIQVEKALLYKKRLISKGKKMLPLSEDEIPFQIPESWLWTKLGRVVNDILVPMRDKPKVFNGTIPWCRIEDIEGKYLNGTKTNKYVSEKTIKEMNLRVNPAGTVISANSASVGVAAITTTPCCTNQTFVGLVCSHGLYNEFLYYYLKANTKTIRKMGTGTTILYVSQEKYWNMPFPLPPLAEQKRIVSKIEELIPFVEQYSAASTKLNTLNTTFPDMMKKSILQEAVQGKLVPQDPNDEPASLLLKKIAEEKKRLIKEGKIKKQKPLPEITEDEIPFDIPDSWEWVHLLDCVLDVADIDHRMPEAQVSGIPYISPLNFTETGIDFEMAKRISEEDYERLAKKCKPEKEDIIFPRYGTIGVLRFIEVDIKFLVSYSSCVVKTSKMNTYPKYIFYALQSPQTKQEISKYINKTTQPNVGMQSIKQFLFPLPPLEEQKRIVARLETVLEFIEKNK